MTTAFMIDSKDGSVWKIPEDAIAMPGSGDVTIPWKDFLQHTSCSGSNFYAMPLVQKLTRSTGVRISVLETARGFVYGVSFSVSIDSCNPPILQGVSCIGEEFLFTLSSWDAFSIYMDRARAFTADDANWHWLLEFPPETTIRGNGQNAFAPGDPFRPFEVMNATRVNPEFLSTGQRLFASLIECNNAVLNKNKHDIRSFYENTIRDRQAGSSFRNSRRLHKLRERRLEHAFEAKKAEMERDFTPDVKYNEVLSRAEKEDVSDMRLGGRRMLSSKPPIRFRESMPEEEKAKISNTFRQRMLVAGHSLKMAELAGLCSELEDNDKLIDKSMTNVRRSSVSSDYRNACELSRDWLASDIDIEMPLQVRVSTPFMPLQMTSEEVRTSWRLRLEAPDAEFLDKAYTLNDLPDEIVGFIVSKYIADRLSECSGRGVSVLCSKSGMANMRCVSKFYKATTDERLGAILTTAIADYSSFVKKGSGNAGNSRLLSTVLGFCPDSVLNATLQPDSCTSSSCTPRNRLAVHPWKFLIENWKKGDEVRVSANLVKSLKETAFERKMKTRRFLQRGTRSDEKHAKTSGFEDVCGSLVPLIRELGRKYPEAAESCLDMMVNIRSKQEEEAEHGFPLRCIENSVCKPLNKSETAILSSVIVDKLHH